MTTWRVLWFLIKLGILGAIAVFLAMEPGRVTIDWQGWAIDMPVGIALLAIGLAIFLFVYGERIRRSVFAFPARWRAQRKAIREMKGYRALTLGLVAVAAGDVPESRRQSRRARDLLTDAPLTKLLQAQTARLDGDDQAARAYFEEMRLDPEVAFLGIRGLMTQALRDGDKTRALTLAEEARKLRPTAKWVLLELLDLQMDAGRWARALTTLDEAERTGGLTSQEAAPIRARLSVHHARTLSDDGRPAEALKIAERGVKAAPDNAEAVAVAAELLHGAGKTRKAEKMVEDAWKRRPDPILADAYRTVGAVTASALERVKKVEKLVALAPDHPESHLALADASLDAQLWGEARSHLTSATETLGDPVPPRICLMWARLEEAEHGDLAAAHDWLVRASEQASPTDTPPQRLPAHRDAELPV